MEIKVKKLHQDAILPTYATSGSACFDLYASHSLLICGISHGIIDTGLAFEIPGNHCMLIYSRSGHGLKHGIRLANCVGVVDSDYRDSVKIVLHNDRSNAIHILAGDRIAQAMITPVNKNTFAECQELTTTNRSGGFGSTGK